MASFMGGKYSDIDSDYPDVAFAAITGRETQRGGESDFDGIATHLGNGDLVAVSTERRSSWRIWEDTVDDNRIVPGHAYMVDKIEQVGGQRLIHLINPWGPEGGKMEGDDNQKVGDIWLSEREYKENFDGTYSVPGKAK